MGGLSSARVLLKKELLIQRVDKKKLIALLLLVIPTILLATHQGGGGLVPASLVFPLAPVLFSQLLTSLFAGDDLQMEKNEKMLEVMKSMDVDFRLMLACKSAITALLPTIAGCFMMISAGLLISVPIRFPSLVALGVCYVALLFVANVVTALLSVAASIISSDATFLNTIRVFSPFVVFAPIAVAGFYFSALECVPGLLGMDAAMLALAAILLNVLPSRLAGLLGIRSIRTSPSL